MKIKLLGSLMIAGIFAAGLTTSAFATTIVNGFGTIPGIAPGTDIYSGSGIPNAPSVWSQATGPTPGVKQDVLTLALSTSARGAFNPTPTDNGAGTFYVNTGLVGGRSQWNFDFYANTSANPSLLGVYSLLLTITGPNGSTSFSPYLILDNVGGPKSAGNSESLDFAFLGNAIGGYDPNADATYDVTLSAILNATGTSAGSVHETIVAGKGSSVPDTASTGGLLAACMGGFALVNNRKKLKQVVAML